MATETDSTILLQQIANLANMADRVATPEFKQGFHEYVRTRARKANSSLTYRNAQGQLVQEWPNTGHVEILAE